MTCVQEPCVTKAPQDERAWIEKIVEYRIANFSNVYIVETEDPLDRSEELLQVLLHTPEVFSPRKVEGTQLVPAKSFAEIFTLDILNGTCTTEIGKGKGSLQEGWNGFLNTVHSSAPAVAIVKFIYRQQHVDLLSDRLMSFAFDSIGFKTRSFIVAFTSSAALWPREFARFVAFVNANATEQDLYRAIKRVEEMRGIQIPPYIKEALKGLSMAEARAATLLTLLKDPNFSNGTKIIEEVKREKLAKLGLRMRKATETFDHIGGYDSLKDYIKKFIIIPLKNPEKAAQLGVRIPRGLLLFGPPGTGKSLFARVIAGETGLPFMELDPSAVFGSLVGETEARIARIRDTLETMGPVVLFVDEAESLFPHRGQLMDTAGGVFTRSLNMMLSWLGDEQRKTVIIMTSNYPDRLDPALLRRGRIDMALPVVYPDKEERLRILRVHTEIKRRIPLAADVNLEEIAKEADHWSGADLEALVQDASRIALAEGVDKVSRKHFEEAMSNFKINIAERKEWLDRTVRAIMSQPDAPIVRALLPQEVGI